MRVQAVEHDPGLHHSGGSVLVEGNDPVEELAVVDDEGGAHRLAALRAARTSRENRHAFFHGDSQRYFRVLLGLRHDHAHRVDLIDRGVGRIAAAAGRIEEDFAFDFAREAPRKRAVTRARMKRDG